MIKLPPRKDQYAWLAELRLIKYYIPSTGKVNTQKFGKDWSLLWNPTTKILLGVKNSILKKLDVDGDSLKSLPAMKAFIDFQDHSEHTDYDFSKNWKSVFHYPIKFELLGKGKQIDYYSDKFNKGQFHYYYHEFGEYDQSKPIVEDHKVMIYYDRKNNIILVKGGKLTVTKRGIIN